MKKILHVIPTLNYGGISSVICNWHDVCHNKFYHFDYISFNDGPLRSKFESDASKIHILPTIRTNPIAYFRLLITIIKKGQYDGVHVHNSFKNGAVLFLARLFGVKIRVCHSHTSGLEDRSLKKYISFLKWFAITNANVRLACGKTAGEFLYNDLSFKVINNTIDVERMFRINPNRSAILKKFKIPEGRVLIGHVGRFSEVKNHNHLIELAKVLDHNYHFVLVGSGPKKDTLIQKVNLLGVAHMFTFVDPTTEIPNLLSVFDIFALPSFFEGVSLALLEAQAASLPCVVSQHVPVENDVSLGLVKFLPLTDLNVWVRNIVCAKKVAINKEQVTYSFDLAGYTNMSLIKNIESIYG